MQGKKHLSEKLFLSFQLSQRVPADNFYRRLKDQLDLQFVYKSTKKYYGTEGQQSIDPVVFFKLILVGYLENLNSDRKNRFLFWSMKNFPGIVHSAAPGSCMAKRFLGSSSVKYWDFVYKKAWSAADVKPSIVPI